MYAQYFSNMELFNPIRGVSVVLGSIQILETLNKSYISANDKIKE